MPDGEPNQPVKTNRAKDTGTMMNDLNTIMIEGIVSNPHYYEEHERLFFKLFTIRYYKSGEIKTIETDISCTKNLAHKLKGKIKGQKARVLGRLEYDSVLKLHYISAEKVEIIKE